MCFFFSFYFLFHFSSFFIFVNDSLSTTSWKLMWWAVIYKELPCWCYVCRTVLPLSLYTTRQFSCHGTPSLYCGSPLLLKCGNTTFSWLNWLNHSNDTCTCYWSILLLYFSTSNVLHKNSIGTSYSSHLTSSIFVWLKQKSDWLICYWRILSFILMLYCNFTKQ